jgi:subtilisin family serine protease
MPRPSSVGLLAVVAAAVVALLLGPSGSGGGTSASVPETWRGIVGGASDVTLGQRVIVVLKAPSLAQQVAAAGGIVSTREQRRFTSAAYAAQQQLITRFAVRGIGIKPEYSFGRVLNGFSAAIDPGAIALLERSSEVAGVYPVRPAFPATAQSSVLQTPPYGPGSGRRPAVRLPGYDGRGVTIALLDTGVDRAQPFLRGRVVPGIDVVGGAGEADAAADPLDPTRLETHGTQLAGLLVGGGGPGGLAGVATGAQVLPIRVAGWQLDARGGYAVYGRSDQIIQGLERAVDPNGDGDAHDAARIALIGLAERFAGFADSPEARAVEGALALDTLVVAPAGNDGAAGPGYGSIAGPGGAPAALTVGAGDSRRRLDEVRVVLRRGLEVLLDRKVPLLGAVAPAQPLELAPAAPRRRAARELTDFFDLEGFSLVAGKAAVVGGGDRAADDARAAADAGAAAVVLYGSTLPAGSLGIGGIGVPVVSVPGAPALAALYAEHAGADVQVTIGAAESRPNPGLSRVAAFSSRGLAFDGRVKPELVAPGVGIATSDPGKDGDGQARFVSVNGSSAAAAIAAGAAALLAQARPQLDARSLKSLLVGNARRTADATTTTGSGFVDVGAAAAAEVAASPASLAFGAWTGAAWRSKQTLTIRNVSTRRLRLTVTAHPEGGESEVLAFAIEPARLVVRQGQTATVTVTARLAAPPAGDVASGSIEVTPFGGKPLRIPWAIDYRPYTGPLLADPSLSVTSFRPSSAAPSRLSLDAGAVVRRGELVEVQPVALLDVQLWRGSEALGLLARVRDLLPGRYTFGLTGRDANGRELPPGPYRLRLVAWPTGHGRPTVRSVPFTVA